jgi:hypothetical protein
MQCELQSLLGIGDAGLVGKPFRRQGPGDAQIGTQIRLHRDMTRTLMSSLIPVAVLCSQRYGFTITISASALLLTVTALGAILRPFLGRRRRLVDPQPSASGCLQSCVVLHDYAAHMLRGRQEHQEWWASRSILRPRPCHLGLAWSSCTVQALQRFLKSRDASNASRRPLEGRRDASTMGGPDAQATTFFGAAVRPEHLRHHETGLEL